MTVSLSQSTNVKDHNLASIWVSTRRSWVRVQIEGINYIIHVAKIGWEMQNGYSKEKFIEIFISTLQFFISLSQHYADVSGFLWGNKLVDYTVIVTVNCMLNRELVMNILFKQFPMHRSCLLLTSTYYYTQRFVVSI